MKPKRIILVRHGESAGNADPEFHEHTQDHKIPLTELGEEQARQAGKRIRAVIGEESVHFYISPYLRTRQTHQMLAAGLGKSDAKVYEDPRLREQDFGHLRPREIARIVDDERDQFGTFFYRIPDGESGADVYDRMSTFLETMFRDFQREDFPQNAVIVTHGLTIRLFLMRYLHWTYEEFETARSPKNCDVFVMNVQENGKYKLAEPFPKYEPKKPTAT